MGLPSSEIDQLLVGYLMENNLAATVSELNSIGVDPRAIERRVISGLLIRPARGVVGLAGAPDPVLQRRKAALLARPDSVLARLTAADVHSMPVGSVGGEETQPTLLIPRSGSRRASLGRVVSSGHIPSQDVTSVDGLRVTTRERTFLDLAAHLGQRHLRWLGERLILDGRISTEELVACAAGLVRKGRDGSANQRLVVEQLLGGGVEAASDTERRFTELLNRIGITGWVTQFRPPWYDGRRGVVDFAWPDLHKIIEVDGRRWHASSQDLVLDRQRDRTARRHGWEVARFMHEELVHRPVYVEDEVRHLLGLHP